MLRKRFMELDHKWLILRANRANGDRCTIGEGPGIDIALGIRANGKSGQCLLTNLRAVQYNARIKGEETMRRCQQRVNIDFLNPGLLSYQVTKANQQLLKRDKIDRRASAYPLESGKDARLFHHTPRQRGREGWKCQSMILIDLHQLSS